MAQIEPIDVFNVLKTVPSLFEDFRKECYTLPPQESLDYQSDSEKKYDHKRGIAFLKKHNIPTTHEELTEDSKYTYTSVMNGELRYNVGQMIVLFSETIYSSGDMTSENTWVLEVMDEFNFPANKPLHSYKVESIREALKEYLDSGIIKLHNAGLRMYRPEHTYNFAERINKVIVDDTKD